MKCKHCNGTGKVRGYFYEKTGVNKWEKVWGDPPCDECNGTGQIEMTNEEWLDGLSTEEKAKWIATQCGDAVMESTYDVSKLRKKRYWVEWLKQPHKGE